MIYCKDGVQFTVISPGGFCMLSAFERASSTLGQDLTITSACDGDHSGPSDPHHSGNAYDIRSHDFSADEKTVILNSIISFLPTGRFFGFLESPGTDNEHFHFQVKKGTTYP